MPNASPRRAHQSSTNMSDPICKPTRQSRVQSRTPPPILSSRKVPSDHIKTAALTLHALSLTLTRKIPGGGRGGKRRHPFRLAIPSRGRKTPSALHELAYAVHGAPAPGDRSIDGWLLLQLLQPLQDAGSNEAFAPCPPDHSIGIVWA